jgi:hypothetical protein
MSSGWSSHYVGKYPFGAKRVAVLDVKKQKAQGASVMQRAVRSDCAGRQPAGSTISLAFVLSLAN